MKSKALHLTVITNTSLPVSVCVHAHSCASVCERDFLCQSITVSYWHHCHFGWMSARFLWFTRSAFRHKVSFPCHHKRCDCNLIHTQTNTKQNHTHKHAYPQSRTPAATYIRTGNNSLWSPHFPHQKVGQLWLQHQPKMKELSGLSLAQSTLH